MISSACPVISLGILLSCGLISTGDAQSQALDAEADFGRPRRLQMMVNAAAAHACKTFAEKRLQTNQLAISLVDLRDPRRPIQAHYRGDAPFYPASVIKLFYLTAAHRWMEDGKLANTEELRRAMRDMIVDSSNDATHYVVDSLTGTTGGPELPENEMQGWTQKRNAVNRYFASLAYTNINVNQKPWGDGPYGRERLFVGKNYENRNVLTTEATARLLLEIVLRRAISALRSAEMMKLLERDPFKKKAEASEPDQNYDFTGATALPAGTKLWSKAGWTSSVRHDAAYLELPDGTRFVLVTFTSGHSDEREIIPTVAKEIMDGLSAMR